jgi:hypothetical protein
MMSPFSADDISVSAEQIEWSRQLFRTLKNGGRWGVPRTGIILEKRDDKLVLVGQMRKRDRKLMQNSPNDIEHRFINPKVNHLEVVNSKILNAEQRLEYQSLRILFAKANITMADMTGDMPYLVQEHNVFRYGIVKQLKNRDIVQRLGTCLDQKQAVTALVMQGFDLANMELIHGTRRDQSPENGL